MSNQSCKNKRHINIPIFIPHLGCPNDCVFCNQRKISGKLQYDRESAEKEIRKALETINTEDTDTEIAFFGGSFTGIDRDEMIYLLDTAKKFTDSGEVQSIRLSTRPDYISEEILEILGKYKVRHIELGIQSMDDNVLAACRRGHTSEDTVKACRLIKEAGFELVGQMMTGLPGADLESEIMTAEKICSLGADAARIYPTVVLKDTELAEMTYRYEAGQNCVNEDKYYAPLTLEESVFRTREALFVFYRHMIPVIRIGLCSADNLTSGDDIASGAYHPAIGELVQSSLYMKLIEEELSKYKRDELCGRDIVIEIPRGETSKLIGQKRCNKLKIQNEYSVKNIKVIEKDLLREYNIRIDIL